MSLIIQIPISLNLLQLLLTQVLQLLLIILPMPHIDLIHRLHLRKRMRRQLKRLILHMLLRQIHRVIVGMKR